MGTVPVDLREIHSIGAETHEWMVSDDSCPMLRDHRIHLYGISAARPGFNFVRHAWERSQILVSYGGKGEVLIAGGWRVLAANQAYLTPPGAVHGYRCLPRASWRVCWVVSEESTACPPLVTAAAPTIVTCDSRPLHDSITNLHRELLGAHEPALLRQWADLAAVLMRRILAPVAGDGELWLLWEEIDADLGHAWTLGDLARHAGLGSEQLRRRCQQAYQMSPMAYLTRLRMRRAAALLAVGDRSVATVAALVGYQNPFAFSTAFRRAMRCSPSQWGLRKQTP